MLAKAVRAATAPAISAVASPGLKVPFLEPLPKAPQSVGMKTFQSKASTLEDTLKSELRAFLEASLAAGLASLPVIAQRETGPGWSPAEMEGYLRRFHYRLGPEDLQGLSRFESLLGEHDLLAAD